MNTYDLHCYEKTYHDPLYWDKVKCNSPVEQKEVWGNCREFTDQFYNELVARGYLLPKTND